jgi:hypothetical protein
MTQTLEQFRVQMRRELSAMANEDLKTEVRRVQVANGLSFDEAWRRTERETPGLFRVGAAVGSSPERESPQSYPRLESQAKVLIAASDGTMTMAEALNRARGNVVKGSTAKPLTRDPRLQQEMGKHAKLEESRQSAAIGDHVDRLARIREMMTKNPKLTFDQCFTVICREESEGAAPASATQSLTTSRPATAKVDAESGKTFLVRGIEVGLVTKFGLDS